MIERLRPWLRLAWVMAAACTMLLPRPARAIEYEVFVDVDDEEDIYDLFTTEQISESTFDDLIDLIRRGVDLQNATRDELYSLPNLTYDDVDRILAYREEAGRIADPSALVAAGVVTERQLAAIAAFIRAPEAAERVLSANGQVRYQTIWSARDRQVPPMLAQARVRTLRYLTVGGAAVVERNRLAPVTWDPNRDALVSEGPRPTVRAPKYFVQWDTPKWGIIAGTYTMGFGQRLVFDNSRRYTPNGFYLDDLVVRRFDLSRQCRQSTGELEASPCPTDEPRDYVTPDYRLPERLRGVAVGAHRIDVPTGWLQAYGFFSYQTKPVYQYRVWDRDRCDDPRLNGDLYPQCRAPSLLLRQDDPLEPAPGLSFYTLPNMYDEILGGGNVGWSYNHRTHIGVTGYGATTRWRVDGANLDFQESERLPYGGPFGAVGADMAWGRAWADVFLEVAHSFDSTKLEGAPGGGGGPAVIGRHTATWDAHEIEASLRYYDSDYANPFARPIAAADQFQGLRARDEAGGRLRYTGTFFDRIFLRTLADFWAEVQPGIPQAQLYVHSDFQATNWWRPGLWVDYRNRDLLGTGRDRCFDQGNSAFSESAEAESFSASALEYGASGFCTGERLRLTARSLFDAHRRVSLTAQYRHIFADDTGYDDRFRQDMMASLLLSTTPIDPMRLRARVRYDYFDILDNSRYEQTFWSYMQVGYQVRRWFIPSLRYDIRVWLDDRPSTTFRRPNPEHWVLLEIDSRF